MVRLLVSGAGVSALAVAAFAVSAPAQQPQPPTPTRVTFPANLAANFVRYDMVDKVDRKRVRYLYVDKVAAEAMKAGGEVPNGAVIVMEDHEVELDGGGAPILTDGRLRPTATVTGYFVMEKRAGWGETSPMPPDQRNGDWEYAMFRPGGERVPAPLGACYACHLPLKGADYLFSKAALDRVASR